MRKDSRWNLDERIPHLRSKKKKNILREPWEADHQVKRIRKENSYIRRLWPFRVTRLSNFFWGTIQRVESRNRTQFSKAINKYMIEFYKWDIPSDLQSWFDLIVSELSSWILIYLCRVLAITSENLPPKSIHIARWVVSLNIQFIFNF